MLNTLLSIVYFFIFFDFGNIYVRWVLFLFFFIVKEIEVLRELSNL